MTPRLESIVARFESARPSGAGQYMVRCPAHDDRQASLAIGPGRDRILLHCHAGCPFSRVLHAAGLTPADLKTGVEDWAQPQQTLDPPKPASTHLAAVRYRYVDERGRLLYEVWRLRGEGRRFATVRPDPGRSTPYSGRFVWGRGGGRFELYRLPDVVRAVQRAWPVYVCEGEKDAHSLFERGATATTAPGGAKRKWEDRYTRRLRGAHVVVVADMDGVGLERAREVAAALRPVAVSLRVVRPRAGKDAHDHSAAGHGLDDFEELPW